MERKKILIVDDDEIFLRLVERDLSHAGYAVLTAKNGKEGVTLAQNEHPNLILLDLDMPVVDGATASQTLKMDSKTKNIPVIFVTSLITKNEERDEHLRGGNFFMAKPYMPKELLAEIQKHVG